MNQTGYTVLKIPKTGAAFAYAKQARDFATGATGAGGYLHTTATNEQWRDVRFVSAILEGSSSLPVSIGASYSDLYTGVTTVIGGTTPIGDLRSEDGPYVTVGSSSLYYTKKGQEYGGAFYAAYIGGTNSLPTKIGVGTTAGDVTANGYFEGSFTTNDIHEFQTSFTADSTDLSKITTGSGVYTEGADVTLQFNILNRNGEQLSSAAQIAADPFVSGQKISILNTDGTIAFSDYRIGGDSTFTFSSSQNIDVFGTFTRNFGIRNQVVNQDGGVHTSEFYLYANTATFDKVFVRSSGQTVLNESYTNNSPPNTGSIPTSSERANALKYFNNQPINDSGVTGFIEFDLGFNESPNFTSLGDLVVFYGTSGDFTTNRSSLVGNFPLNSVQEGQRIRLTANDGIPEGTGLFFKLAADTEVGFNEELFNVGPFTLEPEVEGPDLNLYNQGDQTLVGDFTIEGGLEGDDADGGNLNVSGNALGTGEAGRLTGPTGIPYLLSGDAAGTESDTLQTVTARGNTTVGLDVNFQDILYVDHTNDRVGIGTISPQTPLHVESESFFDGNVGIGTINPTQKLDVNGIITSKGLQTNTTNTNYNLISRNNAGNSPLYVQSANSNTDQPIAFFSYGSATANAGTKILKVGKDKSYFDNTNVGIGSTIPTVALDVAGAGKFTSQVTIPATPLASTDAASKGYVDAQVGSADTLQEVVDNGNATTTDINYNGSKIIFNGDTDKSIGYSTDSPEGLLLGTDVKSIKTAHSDQFTLFPNQSVAIGASAEIIGASPATGSAVLGGTGNRISGHFNTLVGGAQNKISGDLLGFNFIGGGSGIDVIDSQYSSSVGGYNNDVLGSDYSVIAGGHGNKATGVNGIFIGGGFGNTAKGGSSVIVGGQSNTIHGNSNRSFIGAGASNVISGEENVIGGGNNHLIEGSRSVILGGDFNEIKADDGVVAGSYSKVQAGHGGAFVFSDSNSTPTLSTGANAMVLNFAGGVHVPTSGVFGQGLFVSGVPVLTGENNPAEADTLQTVTDRGATTTNSITVGLTLDVADSVRHAGDTDTRLDFAPDQVKLVSNGITRLQTENAGVIINEGGVSADFRVEGDTDTHALFVDGSADNVGIGVNTPTTKLAVDGTISGVSGQFDQGLFISGVPVSTGSAAEADTLQTVTDRGATSTNAISVSNVVTANQFNVGNEGKVISTSTLGLQLQANSTDKPIIFSTNSGGMTERMRITRTGVGIGVPDPVEMLELGAGGRIGLTDSAGTYDSVVYNDGSTFKVADGAGSYHVDKINLLGLLDLGVGHTIKGVDNSIIANKDILAPKDGSFGFRTYGATNQYDAISSQFIDNNNNALSFNVKAGGTTSEAFRIDKDGNIGVDTTAPLAKLDVRGDISGSGSFLGTGVGNRITNNGVPYLLSGDSPAETQTLQDVCDNGNTTTTAVNISGDITVANNIFKNVENSSLGLYGGSDTLTNDGFIKIHGNANNWGKVQTNIGYDATNSKAHWTLNNTTELMTLKGDGSLGLGTTAPTETLDVRGTTLLSGDVTVADGKDILLDGHSSQIQFDTTSNFIDKSSDSSMRIRVSDNSATLRHELLGAREHDMNFRWFQGPHSSSFKELMTLSASGRLRIGQDTDGSVPLTTLDVRGDISGSGSFLGTGDGNRITNNGVPYLLSGDSPAENDTLQDVTTRGNSTSTSILSTGPHISGVTGLYSDKVGIGTDNPQEKLHVDEGYILADGASTNHGFELRRDSSDTFQIRHLGGNFTINNLTDNRKDLSIDGDGNVGIGTNAPSERLDIVSGHISVQSNPVGGITPPVLTIGQVNNAYQAGLISDTHVTLKSTNGAGNIYFQPGNAQGSRSIVKNDGKMGVNTVSPNSTLHVNGDITGAGDVLGTGVGNRITNNGTPYLLSGDSPAETQTLQDVCDNGNTTTTSIISTGPHISGVTGLYSTVKIGEDGVAGGRLITADSMIFQIDCDNTSSSSSYRFRKDSTVDAGTELMRIQEDGNVGIGTDAPSSTLEVVGHTISISTTGIVGKGFHLGDSYGSLGLFGSSDVGTHYNPESITVSAGNRNESNSAYIDIYSRFGSTASSFGDIDLRAGYSSASNMEGDISLYTSGQNRLIAKHDGNVGVGTSSPDAHLNVYNTGITSSVADVHIVGSGNTYGLLYERLRNDSLIVSKSTSAGSYFKTDSATPSFQGYEIGTNWFLGQYGYNDFRITDGSKSGGTAALTIQDSTQNVGIGTTVPSQTLHVKGIGMIEDTSSTAYGTLQFGTNTSRYIRGNSAELQVGSTIQQLHFQNTSAAGQIASSAADGTDAIQILARTVHTSANILEVVNGNGAAPIFTIDYTGNAEVTGSIYGTGAGNRITKDGIPYLLSGDSPAETQTLQDVCDNGNTTTTSILSSGPYISGVTGLFEGSAQVKGANSWAGVDTQGGAIYMSELGKGLLGNMGSNYARPLISSTTQTINIGSDGTSAIRNIKYNAGNGAGAADSEHNFYTSGSNNRFHIAKDGNVGINYDDPQSKLDVRLAVGGTSPLMDAGNVNNLLTLRVPNNSDPASVANTGAKWGMKLRGYITDASNPNRKTAAVYAVSEDSLGYNRKVGMALHTSPFDADHVERVRIDCDGNVGIGTTNPVQELQVNGNIYAAGGHFFVDNDKSLTAVGDLRLRTNNGTTAVFIDTSQDVGIGTTSPAAKLHVADSSSTSPIRAYNGSYYASIGANNNAAWVQAGGSPTHGLRLSAGANGAMSVYASRGVAIGEYPTTDPGADNFTVAGNVGIGTNSPSSTLHVYDSAGPTIKFERNSNSNLEFIFGTANTSIIGAGELQFRANGGTSNKFVINNSLITASADLYVNANVGIGTSSPSYELDVNGTTRSTYYIGGAYLEENASSSKLKLYPDGTVLVINKDGELEPCKKENDTLVFGVTKVDFDSPVVLGAEPVLVTGPVEVGDYIVTSNKQGHGQAAKDLWKIKVGTVIAQAMESGDGESYNIKAMIRKM
jgi:hypothetical protein